MHRIYWAVLNFCRQGIIPRPVTDILAVIFYKLFYGRKVFSFNGDYYHYFYHYYNRTFASERVVEIPLAKQVLDRYQGKDILEFGNVLHHYFPVTHPVLDKIEKYPYVTNCDVVNFKSDKKYDLIVSVSTLEHVGYSYKEKLDAKKIPVAVRQLKKFLKPGGKMFFTLPVFYNPYLSKLILDQKTGFTKTYYLKRVSYLNDWIQVPFREIKAVKGYDQWYANANALFVGEYTNKK